MPELPDIEYFDEVDSTNDIALAAEIECVIAPTEMTSRSSAPSSGRRARVTFPLASTQVSGATARMAAIASWNEVLSFDASSVRRALQSR